MTLRFGSSKPRSSSSPKQELNLSCTNCGKPALLFESFVTGGPMHELVAAKIAEMTAFLAHAPDQVKCQACTVKQKEEHRRQEQELQNRKEREAREAKARAEREERELRERTQRNEELVRQASVKSQRNEVSNTGSLRRQGSRRSVFSRIRDSFFPDEDYITEPEDNGDAGSALQRNASTRSVRFQEPARNERGYQLRDTQDTGRWQPQEDFYPMEYHPSEPVAYQPRQQQQTQSPPPALQSSQPQVPPPPPQTQVPPAPLPPPGPPQQQWQPPTGPPPPAPPPGPPPPPPQLNIPPP